MPAFAAGNRKQSVFSPRASVYVVGALTGKTAPTSFIIEAPRQFRLFSPLLVGVPQGLPGGHTISANLLPATTPQASGGRLRIQIELGGTGAITEGDVLVNQA